MSLSRFRAALAWLVMIILAACAYPAHAGPIPAAAQQHQRELTRIVQQEWGLSGPVTVHAAQIHQESAWRPGVDSRVGAQGLAQFMPSTSAWIVEVYPDLGAPAPYSPTWAMRAMVRYNRWHWQRLSSAADECQRWAFSLSAYNGGLGWVQRDQRLARVGGDDPGVWFDSVEHYTARAGWAKRENRQYVRRILLELAPRYERAGWRGGVPC